MSPSLWTENKAGNTGGPYFLSGLKLGLTRTREGRKKLTQTGFSGAARLADTVYVQRKC